MIQRPANDEISFWRRSVPALISGGAAGAFTVIIVIQLFGSEKFDFDKIASLGPSRAIAAALGLFYLAIGMGMFVAAFSPALGKRYIDPEDAEELRRRRGSLVSVGVSAVAFGAGMATLVADRGGILALFLFGIGAAFAWNAHRLSDEMSRQVNRDAAGLAFCIFFCIVSLWGILAQIGEIAFAAPLDWLSVTLAASCVSKIVVSSARGLVKWL